MSKLKLLDGRIEKKAKLNEKSRNDKFHETLKIYRWKELLILLLFNCCHATHITKFQIKKHHHTAHSIEQRWRDENMGKINAFIISTFRLDECFKLLCIFFCEIWKSVGWNGFLNFHQFLFSLESLVSQMDWREVDNCYYK